MGSSASITMGMAGAGLDGDDADGGSPAELFEL